MVTKAKIHSMAPNVVTPSADNEKTPRKGTYIRAGINNNAYIKSNRIPKNLEIFLINFELL